MGIVMGRQVLLLIGFSNKVSFTRYNLKRDLKKVEKRNCDDLLEVWDNESQSLSNPW